MAFTDVSTSRTHKKDDLLYRRHHLSNSSNSSIHAVPDYELEASSLFENHTVDEIREIEKKTRSDIEKKKEELRVMVGERYRDLIDAADTISEMTTSANNVFKSISHMESLCQNLKQNFMVHGFSSRNKPVQRPETDEAVFYGIASQINLLLDMPEKVWGAVDGGDTLLATRLFLLSRHIHTGLYLETTQSTAILSWFPVVTRQWAAISHFKTTILQSCRELVKMADKSNETVAEALCSIMLLEDTDLNHILQDFLALRMTTIRNVLHSDHEDASIKEQILTVVSLISQTIEQVYHLFCDLPTSSSDSRKCNLLADTVNETTRKTSLVYNSDLIELTEAGLLDRHGSVSSRCLPQTVTDYRPTLRASATSLPVSYIQQQCQQWCSGCIEDVRQGVDKLLHFVNYVKRLADIRDAVWLMLTQDRKYEMWGEVCGSVLTSPLNIWCTFLQKIFLQRIQGLITYQLESATEITKRHLAQVVTETSVKSDSIEHDVSGFVWTESSNDIPQSAAWQSAATKNLASGGGLMMKTWTFTPVIQTVCHGFDEKLTALLDDACHYLKDGDKQTIEDGAFNKFADDAMISQHLQTTTVSCIQQLVDYIKQELHDWQRAMDDSNIREMYPCDLKKVLLVGRFCSACCELTFHLSKCILGPDYNNPRQPKLLTNRTSSKANDEVQWRDIRQLLSDTSLAAYSIWTKHTARILLDVYTQAVLSNKCSDALKCFTQWEEVEIREDTDDGQSVNSTIKVPMQPSWCQQQCLYDACRCINTLGGHTLPRAVLQDFVYQLTDGILNTIKRLCTDTNKAGPGSLPLTQQRALQQLFDVKFLLQIIPRKEDHEGNTAYHETGRWLVEWLENRIDPFDLDVFSPFILTNLNKQARRAMILYGAVMSVDRHSVHSQMPTSHQEQHNVLPLAPCPPRFSPLPLSSDATRISFARQHQPPKLSKLSADTSSRSLAASAEAVIESVTSSNTTHEAVGSLYNRIGSMSQIWFSNIGTKS